ncbi:MAG: DUF2065 domain-containing protein [Pseudomonadota bacterium]
MNDLIVGLGLALVIEGLLWAAFPGLAMHFLKIASKTPEHSLRLTGACTIAAGVAIVWAIRG